MVNHCATAMNRSCPACGRSKGDSMIMNSERAAQACRVRVTAPTVYSAYPDPTQPTGWAEIPAVMLGADLTGREDIEYTGTINESIIPVDGQRTRATPGAPLGDCPISERGPSWLCPVSGAGRTPGSDARQRMSPTSRPSTARTAHCNQALLAWKLPDGTCSSSAVLSDRGSPARRRDMQTIAFRRSWRGAGISIVHSLRTNRSSIV